MSKAITKLFGGTDKSTQKRVQEESEQARELALQLFPSAELNRNLGFQSAFDLQAKAIPQQFRTFQQGNVEAQRALLSGIPDFQNALLGGQIMGNVQPVQLGVDTSFANQQVPAFRDIPTALLEQDARTKATVAGINSDVDLFRAAAEGDIGDFGKGDRKFFRQMSNSILAGSPSATRFLDDPESQSGFLLNEDDPRFKDLKKDERPDGLLTSENVDRIQTLLNRFSNIRKGG